MVDQRTSTGPLSMVEVKLQAMVFCVLLVPQETLAAFLDGQSAC